MDSIYSKYAKEIIGSLSAHWVDREDYEKDHKIIEDVLKRFQEEFSFGNIEDLEYFNNKLIRSVGIPSSYFPDNKE